MDADPEEADRGPFVAGEGTVRAFAEASIFGLPVERMLRTRDETERDFWESVRVEAAVVWDTLMTNLARKVVHETAEARKRGKARGGS